VAVVLLVVLTVFGVAAIQAWVGQDGMRAAALERELREEQERMTLLSARVAQLSSPQRLREEAEKLGLVADPSPRYLNAPIERRATRPTPGEATKRLTTPTP
jgi:cell division protein FtsL